MAKIQLYSVILFLSGIFLPCTLSYPGGPYDLPSYWTRGVWLNLPLKYANIKERSKRDTSNLVHNTPKEDLQNFQIKELDDLLNLRKSTIDKLMRTFKEDYDKNPHTLDFEIDETPKYFSKESKNGPKPFSHFATNSKDKLNSFNPLNPYNLFPIKEKTHSKTLLYLPSISKDEFNPFIRSSVESMDRPKPSTYKPYWKPKLSHPNFLTHFPRDLKNQLDALHTFPSMPKKDSFPFSPFPFPSISKHQSPFSHFPATPNIMQNPYYQFSMLSNNRLNPFSPLLRSPTSQRFHSNTFDISTRTLPLTLDDSEIVIEVIKDANPIAFGIRPDTKPESHWKKIFHNKTPRKHQNNYNRYEVSTEENVVGKPCSQQDNQNAPDHGLCIFAVMVLLLLVPMITTCLLKKFNPLPTRKTEPAKI